MGLAYGIAIYFIIWWLSLFAVLPFAARSQAEEGEVVPGTPECAPAQFRIGRIFLINTALATCIFLALYVCVIEGWLKPDTFPLQLPVKELDYPK